VSQGRSERGISPGHGRLHGAVGIPDYVLLPVWPLNPPTLVKNGAPLRRPHGL